MSEAPKDLLPLLVFDGVFPPPVITDEGLAALAACEANPPQPIPDGFVPIYVVEAGQTLMFCEQDRGVLCTATRLRSGQTLLDLTGLAPDVLPAQNFLLLDDNGQVILPKFPNEQALVEALYAHQTAVRSRARNVAPASD